IVLTTLPAQDVDIAPGGTQTICKTDSVVLSTQTDAPTYEWLRDGTVIAGATLKSYTARVPGDYQVRLASTSGCPGISAIVKVRTPNVRYRFVPTSLDFGTLGQCKSDTTVSIDLVNDSPIAITITSAKLPAGFALAFPAPGFVVAPNGRQTVQILFTPSTAGISAGTVTFTAVPCDVTATFTVRGIRTQVSAALDRAQVDFGTYTACTNTDIRPDSTFRVTNAGTSTIRVRVPKVSPPFYLLTPFPSAGIDVLAGQNLPISIQYRPLGADRDRGVTQQIAFPFTSSTCSDTLRAQLQAASYKPLMTVDPDTMDVGLVLSCASTFDTVVTVTNPTPVPLTVTGIAGTGFVFTGSATTIEPNTSRSISVGILPGGTSGPFSIDGELLGSPCGLKSSIHAEGLIVAPRYTPSTSLLDVGDVTVCGIVAPVTKSVYVVAGGLSGLRSKVNAVNVGGPFTTDLVVGTTFTDTLRFTVTFQPNTVGSYTNAVILDLGPCQSPVRIDLSGDGVSVGRTTTITGSNFGTVGPGQSSTQTIVITNTGGDTLDVVALKGITAPFRILSSTPTLPTRLAPLGVVTAVVAYDFVGFDRRDTITITSTTSGVCPDTTRFEVRGATTSPGVLTGIVVVAPTGVVATAGQTVDIPLSLESVQPLDGAIITQMTVNVSYDPTLLRPLSVGQGASGAQGTIAESTPGKARISITSATPIVSSQPLVIVKAATYVSSRTITPFKIDSVSMPGAVVTGRDGSVTIVANCMVSAELTALGQPVTLRIERILPTTVDVTITTLTDDPSSLTVYDLVGRSVLSPFEATLPIGTYRVTFDSSSLPSGSYLLVYRHGQNVRTETVHLTR
ncbi:MAG: choice-of-anchor D domain-containing protein, partial [Candidatus Kapabacteria bacterium]|nr:choice-of-anchor D domain-containing protein [Candidatus Kapabacteria bacterium]